MPTQEDAEASDALYTWGLYGGEWRTFSGSAFGSGIYTVRERIQVVLGVVAIIAGGLAALFVVEKLAVEGSRNPIWLSIVPGVIAMVALAGCVMLNSRDIAPDFLQQQAGRYFDCEGFCFAVGAKAEGGVCHLFVLFQNRFAGACRGRVALRPARKFFLTREQIPTVGMDIECPGGAFGIAWMPWPVPKEYQGTMQKFDVGATAAYAGDRGKKLRFTPGLKVRGGASSTEPFGSAVGLTPLGGITISSPALATVRMPENVAETAMEEATAQVKVLWRMGDPVGAGGPSQGSA